jgi:purine-nucleoside/S-methyl-5'-thioadenosine phosphorylase / adenosine deaminase
MGVMTSRPPLAGGSLLWRETATATYLEPRALSAHARLRCAFTTRHAGRSGQSLNLSFDKGERTTVLAQRQHVLQALGLAHMPLCTVRQVHGNQVCVVDATLLQRGLTGIAADALVTNLAQVALGILVADCLPIVLYALDTPVIALVHAGRMGTYYRVVQHTLEVLARRFATLPAQVHAVLGPAIGACCYMLDRRAVGPFQERFPAWEQCFIPHGPEHWTMDLLMANTLQLRAAGVPAEHIETASICTACHKHDLYSHRAEGQEAGRGMAIVARTSTARASQ